MAAAAAAVAGAAPADGQGAQPQQRRGGFLSSMMNMMLMYWIVTSGVSFFGGGNNSNNANGGAQRGGLAEQQGGGDALIPVENAIPTSYSASAIEGMRFSMKVTFQAETALLSNNASLVASDDAVQAVPQTTSTTWVPVPGWRSPTVSEPSIPFSLTEGTIEKVVQLNVSACVAVNCTIRATVVYSSLTDPAIRVNYTTDLVFFLPEKVKLERNLFDEAEAPIITKENSTVTKAFMQVALTVCPVVDFSPFSDPIPDPIKPFIRPVPRSEIVDNSGKAPRRVAKYLPIIYNNDFWVMKNTMVELNATTPDIVNVTVTHYPMSLWKFMMYSQMNQAFTMHESTGLMGKGERDETKRIFLETNPYFLGLTVAVSLLHLVFEYLAFSNDVSFWRGKKNFKGLSLRTVALNCYFQTIIFLYLFDGDTSWTVYVPSGVGVLIEYWKLRKVILVTKNPETGRWNFEFKTSYDNKTRRYDQQAMRYLTYLLVPCLLGYSVYSALYHSYKGWYSFFITTQVRFIYFSGFVMMTPQIFINYKMKSVAHLPWRTFVYKALNTFIDDMFAFIITMPTMHRLACFRDDIIFFILLYQRWIYPVDKRRTEDSDEESADAASAAAAVAGGAPGAIESKPADPTPCGASASAARPETGAAAAGSEVKPSEEAADAATSKSKDKDV